MKTVSKYITQSAQSCTERLVTVILAAADSFLSIIYTCLSHLTSCEVYFTKSILSTPFVALKQLA